jgi:hypothetical protein
LCPEILYKENKITNIKYGTLAKIPRNLNVLSSMDNQFLSIKDIEKEYSVEIKIKNKKEGSISNKLFSEEDIKKLDKYKEIFKDLTDNHKLKARNHVVTEDDFAIALLILLFINKNPNKDGSIPTERVKQLWISLFKFNNVKRNWNHHRWKVIRDLLSMKNLIDWTDNKYEFGNKLNNQKGVACKWSLSNKLLRKVNNLVSDAHDAQKTERASLMDTNITIIDKTKEDNRYLTPILRFLRTINYEDMLTRMFSRMETLCTV